MAGRPTDYKPEYCQMLIDHMAKGYSFESFAGLIRAARSSIYLWIDVHEEFSDAKKEGLELCRLFWEGKAIELIEEQSEYDSVTKTTTTRKLNTTLWIFNMKNRFKDEWSDTHKQEVEVKNMPDWMQDDTK